MIEYFMKENLQDINIKYTICFCIVPSEKSVLMVLRANSPNKNKLNGLGGKIQENETPEMAIKREMLEEAEIDISTADSLKYVGIVTWKGTRPEGEFEGGMHAYLADFNDPKVLFSERQTREGILNWHQIKKILDKNNKETVENIPRFLPLMLENQSPWHYHCTYINDELINFEVFPLTV